MDTEGQGLLTLPRPERRARAGRAALLVDGAYYRALRTALLHAQREVLIAGWDVDGRTELAPGEPAGSSEPSNLLEVLRVGLARNPDLHVHVLLWDFSPIYWLEREEGTAERFRALGPRVHFAVDSLHPAGASHHQKLVAVDRRLAFVGGVDLTIRRWDTCAHRPDDPARTDPGGEIYAPMHDAQLCVDGGAAQQLAELILERFERAGHALAGTPSAPVADPWPAHVEPDFLDVDVQLTITRSSARPEEPELRSSEAACLHAIRHAKRSVYVENQYLTAASIAAAIGERLAHTDAPEFLVVLPREECGWLERRSMGELRRRTLAALRERDRHGRLRVVYPVIDAVDERVLNVHTKLMIVDQQLIKVGSSNFSNRSMGLDTECDAWLALEPTDQHGHPGVRAVLARLLAEHCGAAEGQVLERLAAGAGLFAIMDELGRPDRRLSELPRDSGEPLLTPFYVSMFDPERPEMPEAVVDVVLPLEPHSPRRRVVWSLIFSLIALAGLWLLVRYGGEHARPLLAALRGAAQRPWGGVLGSLIFAGATLLFTPLTLLVATAALVFEPFEAVPVMLAGSLLSATVGHLVGSSFGTLTVRLLGERRMGQLRERVQRHGLWSTLVARALPVGNFTVVNLLAGALGVRRGTFLIGSALGMLPGFVVMTLLVHELDQLVLGRGARVWLGLGATVLALGALAVLAARTLRHRAVVKALASEGPK
jgi:phospholipase D1/2